MVELTLVADSAGAFAKDCFISVRVGESQKLSRMIQKRQYKFPQAGERTYGKIEIFRRIGACAVDIDPQNEGTRDVHISCGELGMLNMSVDVGAPGTTKMESIDKNAAPKEGEKVQAQAAKDYLRKHSVELQLAEAMQAVLRERPENPVEFLAKKLLSNMNDGGVALAPHSPTKAVSVPGPAPLKPFNQYVATHFRQAPQAAFDRMYSRFPGPKKTLVFPVAATRSSWQHKPSVGTWLSYRRPPPPAPVHEPFVTRPSVGTWYMKPTKAALALFGEAEAQAPAVKYPYPLPAKPNRLAVSSGIWGPQFSRLQLAPRMVII